MKRYIKFLMLSVAVISLSSCKKFLDINTNTNSLTQATPALILPQAIVQSAAIGNTFNTTFSELSGATANAGGFGGFGSVVTYDFGTGNFSPSLWPNSYNNANDFQYVINETAADPKLAYSTAIARIMKSLTFERLVNQFNDVPYTDALKGQQFLQPKYDKAEDVYKACIADLTKGIDDIIAAQASQVTEAIAATADPMFGGNMELWKKFANTVKLRMLIKMAGVSAQSTYATSQFNAMNTTVGFLVTDALVNPKYEKTTRPSPVYNSLGYTTTGAVTNASRIPSKWMYSFYNGGKLSDANRGKVIYRGYPSVIINQLGDESATAPRASSAGSAFTTLPNAAANEALGVVKGPTQSTPLLLAAESYFLQAEAYSRGYLTGSAATAFDAGIVQSFTYLYKNVNNVVDPSKNVATDVAAYKNANSLSAIVNFNLAISLEQKVEAIITQKYIALNMIANDENFNEFRRTAFPRIVNGSVDPILTFASRQSISPRPDKLPTRVLYPQEEYNLNPANAPTGINKFSSLIFWDIN